MASDSKRIYKSWLVSVALQGDLNKAFDALEQAQAYAQQLNAEGQPHAQIRPYQSTGWQARIRSKLAPQLTRTFPTKASAEEWAKAREGEIVKRQFIDYREADRFTFGDLLCRRRLNLDPPSPASQVSCDFSMLTARAWPKASTSSELIAAFAMRVAISPQAFFTA